MTSMRFVEHEEEFLEHSWAVFRSYFSDKRSFLEQYSYIDPRERKNAFLRLASYYRFFVKAGAYSSAAFEKDDLLFVDQTYKVMAITALIESMYGEKDHSDFHQWLMPREKDGAFPISRAQDATALYGLYKDEYGNAVSVVRFFQSLDEGMKEFIRCSIIVLTDPGESGESGEVHESIEFLAKRIFYQIRCDFVHRAELILEFDPAPVLSVRDGKPFECSLRLDDLCLIFEYGLLRHFNFAPDKSRI